MLSTTDILKRKVIFSSLVWQHHARMSVLKDDCSETAESQPPRPL